MKRLIILLLIFCSLLAKAQIYQKISTWEEYLNRFRVSGMLRPPLAPLSGADTGSFYYRASDSSYLKWTGNAYRNIVGARQLNDSMFIAGDDTITIKGTGTRLNSVGAGYRLVKSPSGQVKSIIFSYGTVGDSTTNTDAITMKADTSSTNHLVTQSDLNDTAAELRSAMPTTLTDTKAFPPVSGMIALGDSYLWGYNVDGPQPLYTYMDVIKSQFGITYTNLSISGAQVRRELKELYTNTTTTPTVPLMLAVGFNNFRGRTDSARRVETVKAAYRSIIANQFAKTFEPPFGAGAAANPKYTFSHSTTGATANSEDSLTDWSSHVYWVRHYVTGMGGANWWKKASITSDETITVDSLKGSNLYIQTWGCDSGYTIMSRIRYAVDGTTIGTYDPNKRSWDITESGFIRHGIINDAIIITGLRDTLHRMVLTFLDGGKMGGIDGVGVLLSPNSSLKQPAFIPAFTHMNATGYAYVAPPVGATQGSLDTATAICKAELQAVFPGYPLYFPNQNALGYYDPLDPTQIQSDGIHPTSKGQYQFYRAILAEISPQKISLASGSSGGDDLNAVTTRGASTSNAIAITGNSTSAYKFKSGSLEVLSYNDDNVHITKNVYFDGSTFRWRTNGYGTLMHYLNNSLAFRSFGSGTAGADAASSLQTPFVVSPSSHVGMGGNMTFDDAMTGATLIARADNKVVLPRSGTQLNIPVGTLNINQTTNNGNAPLEVTGSAYLEKSFNGSQYVVIKNTSTGTSAQSDQILYNNNGDLAQLGIKGSNFSGTGTMAAGVAYFNSTGTAGTVIHATNGPIKISSGAGFTESARWTGGALLINRTSAIGSEKLSVNGSAVVADDAYDATTWNSNNEVPTKNAVRDKIESLSSGNNSFLNKQYTTTQNSGSTQTDLYTYTIPANTLTTDGDVIDVESAGFLTDATATMDLQVLFNGSSIEGTTALTLSGTTHWSMKGRIIRTSSSTARSTVTFTIGDGTGKQYTGNASISSLDFTSGIVLKITATAGGGGASTGDILGHLWTVEFKR